MTIWTYFQKGIGWGLGRDLARAIIRGIFR